ncbi:MAG: glutamate synthase subunit beta [Candidatus Latescibacteria bacterium]|nr:glutamate synthase subunit beta [Candidatus Latescibacterota bacterium]
MANPNNFIEINRENPPRRPDEECLNDYREEETLLPQNLVGIQASRCMDCGIPFCQVSGCPLKNRIPDWCLLVTAGKWQTALDMLHTTNNFPEITGRVCPAFCESACSLSVNMDPVIIKHIELQIAEYGWENGKITPEKPKNKTGRKVAVIGSGPAGLVAAQQLIRDGNDVTVFEKGERFGGILRYGIPDYILEKWIIDRRIDQMAEEGVRFEAGVDVGTDLSANYLSRFYDAVIIAVGTQTPRDIYAEGRGLNGIEFALGFLSQQNRRVAGDSIPRDSEITADGKDVVILGAGYTGQYCIGTCLRQGARSVHVVGLPEKPLQISSDLISWSESVSRIITSQYKDNRVTEHRGYIVKKYYGENNHVHQVSLEKVENEKSNAQIPQAIQGNSGRNIKIDADLVLIAAGYTHTDCGSLVKNLYLEELKNGNLVTDKHCMTSIEGVFASGNCVMGPSSVVHAMHHGRYVAQSVSNYLHKKEGKT